MKRFIKKPSPAHLTGFAIGMLAFYGAAQLHQNIDISYKGHPVTQATLDKPADIPAFQLSANIDEQEANKRLFWAKVGE